MEEPRPCNSFLAFSSQGFLCDLPEGHDGDHRCELTGRTRLAAPVKPGPLVDVPATVTWGWAL